MLRQLSSSLSSLAATAAVYRRQAVSLTSASPSCTPLARSFSALALSRPASAAPSSSSASRLGSFFARDRLSMYSPTFSLTSFFPTLSALASPTGTRRHRSQLAPRRTKYRKAHKGRVPIPIGGSLKGTTLNLGDYGLRLKMPARLSAKQLTSAETALKRKLKVVKGSKVFLRVFPDIPVGVKGNETRMGKGKGSFEFWAVRVPIGRVVFEIGGAEIRPELAKEALRLASDKLPVPTEFVARASPSDKLPVQTEIAAQSTTSGKQEPASAL